MFPTTQMTSDQGPPTPSGVSSVPPLDPQYFYTQGQGLQIAPQRCFPTTEKAGQGGTETYRQFIQTSEHESMALPYNENEMNQSVQGNHRAPTTGYNINHTKVNEGPGMCAYILTAISILLIVATFPFSFIFCVKVVQEYERAVIFRLGRLVRGGAKGPDQPSPSDQSQNDSVSGIFFIIPCIDTYCKVDLRTVSFDVPPQEILSKDSVTVAVDAVVYYRISNATIAVSNVEDYGHSTRLLAATTLRNVLGTKNLSEILSERESISHVMQANLDEATDPWGVKVERVEIKDVRLPVQLQRAMATEAEAAREARAKVIAAEGEQRASRALREASEVIADSPSALQLRYLQTLGSIATEKNSTIVFPIPLELFRGFLKRNI
ncbi:band 7 protein AGAP004871-like isoform X1 [Limulus polyphemus]|uniref:Band 7 protein AGAP004871-like isoform X1 n=2 Tax=Limulus polyphemus TaxID=6850 RepID=A0ABM1T392_LIMPO|nr:band 7 protein AGAP004871-like isoform X1 [Limulus polyphemus]